VQEDVNMKQMSALVAFDRAMLHAAAVYEKVCMVASCEDAIGTLAGSTRMGCD
jgi:hypothetical protein